MLAYVDRLDLSFVSVDAFPILQLIDLEWVDSFFGHFNTALAGLPFSAEVGVA